MDKKFLLSNEKVIFSSKPSLISESSFLEGAALIVIAMAIFFVTVFLYPKDNFTFSQLFGIFGGNSAGILGGLPAVPIVLELLGVALMIRSELSVFFKSYVVTNYRISVQSGILAKNNNILLPDKIGDVSVNISILDRILHMGKITIRSQDSAKPQVVLTGIKDPYKLQAYILKLIEKETYMAPSTKDDGKS